MGKTFIWEMIGMVWEVEIQILAIRSILLALGIVSEAKDFGNGWGNVVRVIHNIGTPDQPRLIEALYAHLDTMMVIVGDTLQRGQKLGTIGDAHGAYYAHLHFEIRKKPRHAFGWRLLF